MIDPASLTKRYYKIGEVAKMFGVATSLIRYWEGEFDQLKPQKNANGVRRFLKGDVLVVDKIYDLVKTKGYKLEGAKSALKEMKNKPVVATTKGTDNSKLKSLQSELIEIRKGLSELRDSL